MTSKMTSFAATIVTLFPEMFPGPLAHSLAGKALQEKRWELNLVNLRDYGIGKHQMVDDTPYGGGAGMVIRPDVVDGALTAALEEQPGSRVIYFSPRGGPITQPLLAELATQQLILLCGRYEAIDDRVLAKYLPLELSLGDYVLSGGEIPAMALLDGIIRLLPGVIGDEESLGEESFGLSEDYAGLLEYPHYTKPPVWEGQNVPEVLLSGDHGKVAAWRKAQAEAETELRRPDLWKAYKEKKR